MINYNWNIQSLECYKIKGGLENVIYEVNWRYNGISEETGTKASIKGITALPGPEPVNFIDINDIDNNQIILWLEGIADLQLLRNEIDSRINDIDFSNTFTINL